MKLFYRKLGEGKPLVILHGLFGSSDNWVTIGRKLAETYKIYILDQRNHGQTEDSNVFKYPAMVADLYNFLFEHQIENPTIIGHSMGGKVAMQFAVQYPSLLEKLIVVDISPRSYPIHHHQILEGLASIDLNNIKSRKEADNQLAKYIASIGIRQFLLKNIYRTETNSFAWRINLPVITENIEEVGESVNYKTPCEKPTLFINGNNSDYIQKSDRSKIKKVFPNSSIITILGAGHWVHAEKPKEFLKIVNTFLEK